MKAEQLLHLLATHTGAQIDFTLPDSPSINLNDYGQPNGLQPYLPGRENFTVSMTQDDVELFADYLTREYESK